MSNLRRIKDEVFSVTNDDDLSHYVYAGGRNGSMYKYFVMRKTRHEMPDKRDECLCGHHIKENCFIEHRPTGELFVIGNCCIKKWLPKENQRKTCEICNCPHKRTKTNVCTSCEWFRKQVMPFGKYKKQLIYDIYKSDKKYIEWLSKQDIEPHLNGILLFFLTHTI